MDSVTGGVCGGVSGRGEDCGTAGLLFAFLGGGECKAGY